MRVASSPTICQYIAQIRKELNAFEQKMVGFLCTQSELQSFRSMLNDSVLWSLFPRKVCTPTLTK